MDTSGVLLEENPVVVHLKRKKGAVIVDCDIYIGRATYQGGWKLPTSKWANPYRLADPSDRARVLAEYEAYVRSKPELLAALPELRGKRLGCWCAPLPCHGDVLVRLLAENDSSTENVQTEAPAPFISDDDPLWRELGL